MDLTDYVLRALPHLMSYLTDIRCIRVLRATSKRFRHTLNNMRLTVDTTKAIKISLRSIQKVAPEARNLRIKRYRKCKTVLENVFSLTVEKRCKISALNFPNIKYLNATNATLDSDSIFLLLEDVNIYGCYPIGPDWNPLSMIPVVRRLRIRCANSLVIDQEELELLSLKRCTNLSSISLKKCGELVLNESICTRWQINIGEVSILVLYRAEITGLKIIHLDHLVLATCSPKGLPETDDVMDTLTIWGCCVRQEQIPVIQAENVVCALTNIRLEGNQAIKRLVVHRTFSRALILNLDRDVVLIIASTVNISDTDFSRVSKVVFINHITNKSVLERISLLGIPVFIPPRLKKDRKMITDEDYLWYTKTYVYPTKIDQR